MLYEPGDFDANTSFAPGSDFVVIHLDPPVVERALSELGGQRVARFPSSQVASPSLMSAAQTLAESWLSETTSLDRESRLTQFLSRLLLDHVGGIPMSMSPESRAAGRLRAFLHDNSHRDVSLDALAEATRLNKFYLVRLAQSHLGTTPHAYHLALRMARARTLLREGAVPARLAQTLGFADASHFHRVFVKQVGVTPAQYRRGAGSRAVP